MARSMIDVLHGLSYAKGGYFSKNIRENNIHHTENAKRAFKHKPYTCDFGECLKRGENYGSKH